MLGVALGAFGLEDDINNRAFVERILSDGTIEPDALSNRLADKRYRKFSAAFGFGSGLPPKTIRPDFANSILKEFAVRSFEKDVGEQDANLRLALGARRELSELSNAGGSANTGWYTIMGNKPLRAVFEKAFGLPSSFGALDIDAQLDTFKDIAERRFGASSAADFAEPERMEKLIRIFLVRSDAEAFGATTGSAALTLVSQAATLQASFRQR
ncbi:DUF1217 domain-containing protein [Roseicyclus sp. F158]|uniref:DUF1217 domain-containing protein n=1 Tax=Tropicimonas omnivorans TaxID=3075590 RepID=A0ABU3DDA3_9RHOB|nr:DUF1217 domain-containing protein [Roseicyclus sp. F158]MDT0681695.1 DUF1217 domain-containing protein [Roseicyclus sp. F158]